MKGADSTSLPSQNLGSWSPGTNNRSTPSSVMTHMRMTPPDEPSRDIASASASEGVNIPGRRQIYGDILFLTNSTVSSLPHPS